MQESKQEYVTYTSEQLAWILWGRRPTVASTDPNAAMIARDGPAKPKTCTCGEPHNQGVIHRTDGPCYFKAQPSTTKPPIAGLTRVSAQDHRVGGWGFVR